MKIDFYTKAVLTTIAICLLYFVGKDIATPANASKIVTDINIVEIDGRAIGREALPVRIVTK
jgi:hypothetical protein